MALYSKVEYWNERYLKSRTNPPYEWYQNYSTLAHLLNPETLSGCSGAHGKTTTTGNINVGAAGNTGAVSGSTLDNNVDDDDDDAASASTHAMTNATSAKAFQCLHPNNCRVLILGCGNSQFGANLFEAGWRGGEHSRFVQIDFSPVVIEQMKERYNDKYYQRVLGKAATATTTRSKKNGGGGGPSPPSRMEFVCADVTKPLDQYKNGSFDLIVCKGVFDAVLCSAGSVFNIRRMVSECVRLLNDDGGVLMVVTYGNPDNRVVFLEDDDGELETFWQGVSVHTVPSMVRTRKNQNGHGHGHHHHHHHNSNKNDYVYLCRKRRGAWKEPTSVGKQQQQQAATGAKGGNSKKKDGAENQQGQPDSTAMIPPPKGSGSNKESSHAVKQVCG